MDVETQRARRRRRLRVSRVSYRQNLAASARSAGASCARILRAKAAWTYADEIFSVEAIEGCRISTDLCLNTLLVQSPERVDQIALDARFL